MNVGKPGHWLSRLHFCGGIVAIASVMGALTYSLKADNELPALHAEYSRLQQRQVNARKVVQQYMDEHPSDVWGQFEAKEKAGYLTPEENHRMLLLQERIETLGGRVEHCWPRD